MKKRMILLVFASIGLSVGAQNTMEPGYGNRIVAECQRLHSDGDYKAALTLMGNVDVAALDARRRQEFELLRALTVFENDNKEGARLVGEYLEKYPNSSKKEILCSYVAQGLYLDGRHEDACEWFSKSDFGRLDAEKRDRAELRYALALLGCGRENEAINTLQHLKIESKGYSADAAFYLALISYDKGDCESAHRTFKSIQMDKKYYLEVPYYLAGIFLKQGRVDEAEATARRFIADHGDKPQGIRMRQITGAVEFLNGNYDKAVEELAVYMGGMDEPQRISCYHMGVSLFEEGNDEEAKLMLEKCLDVEDELAQNALLYIGILQHRLGDKTGALVSFERSAGMPFNDGVREEAMYNYAMCLHETNYAAFGKNIKAFVSFLNEYPGSKYAASVDECLIDVYLNTKDYNTALASIDRINEPSAEVLAAKQKILYNIGIQEYTIGNLYSSVEYMNRSLELAKYDGEVRAEALYWKGEALCRVGDSANAGKALRQARTLGCDHGNRVSYSIGYLLFQDKEYGKARAEFASFINGAAGEDESLVADAYSRIGDTYFYQRDFRTAETYYLKAMETSRAGADYPMFRSATTMGLADNNDGKINMLQRLVDEYPESNLVNQAYYEMGRAYIEQKEYAGAIDAYDRLIELSPVSKFARRAATEKAMMYNNMGDVDNAISTYKQIIEIFPGSDEANIAAQDLKNIYVNMGRVNEFAEYAANTDGMPGVESSEIDTLTYMAAERIYDRKNLPEAKVKFQEYLQEFPDGAFVINSHYYIGTICYGEKNYAEAIENFEEVMRYPNNRYSEEAAMCAAEAYCGIGDFGNAIKTYRKVAGLTGSEERRQQALMNIMHAAKQTGNNGEMIDAAGELLKDKNLNGQWRREALYCRVKSLIAMGCGLDAMSELKELSVETRSKEGAEGKYLYAEQLFKQGRYAECEKEISDYMEKNTPHSYWLARTFLLLTDLYQAQGKNKEAKQYLISLKNSYNEDDDIAVMIEERMEKLAE